MPWVGFGTKAAWQTFHDQVCADQLIPRPGKRQSDGTVMLNNCWTDAAFQPKVVDVIVNSTPRKVGIMRVPAAAVTRYNLAGNVITDPTLNDDGTWTITYQGSQYVAVLAADAVNYPYEKPKPATWTDPDTGTVYQVT